MKTTSKSLAQTLSSARLMVAGIRKNILLLAKRGITEARAVEIERLIAEVERMDNEQESLKAQLKLASERLRQKTTELKVVASIDARIIKADIPQAMWVEFGITAKR